MDEDTAGTGNVPESHRPRRGSANPDGTTRPRDGAHPHPGTSERVADSSSLRAECEDDDGYDPYSDRTARKPLFESDPWD